MDEQENVTSTIAPGKRPRFSTIIILILAIVAGGVVLYAFFRNNAVTSTVPEEQSQEEALEEQDEEEQPAGQIPQDWETYTNETMRFSIRHPPDISIETSQNGFIRFVQLGPTQREETELYDGISINIGALPLNNRALREVAEQDAERVEPVGEITQPVSPSSINNVEGFRYQATSLGEYTKYFLPVEGSTMYLEITNFTQDPTGQGFEEIAQQMLNSLEIIEPTEPTQP